MTQPVAIVAAGVLLLPVCGVLAAVDARSHRLPDRLVALAYAVLLVPLVAGVLAGSVTGSRLGWALAAGAVTMVGYFLLGLLRVGGLGLGDVKLSGALGTWLGLFGWEAAVAGVVLTFVLGGLWALTLLVSRRAGLRDHVALGPWMILAAALVTAGAGLGS